MSHQHVLYQSLSLALGVTATGCGENLPGMSHRFASLENPSPLRVVHHTERQVSGAFEVDGEPVARFESVLQKEGRAVSVVVLDGSSFEWVYDKNANEFSLNGHGATIGSEGLLHARAMRQQLRDHYSTRGRLSPAEGLLLGQVEWLADAPVGFVVSSHRTILTSDAGPTESSLRQAGFTDDGVTCLPKGAVRRFYARSDSGLSAYADFEVNATKSCTYSVKGCGSWDGGCMGQCGGGCQRSWENGTFQDCFDHDFCTYFYLDCGQQFRDAADDYVSKLIDRCG